MKSSITINNSIEFIPELLDFCENFCSMANLKQDIIFKVSLSIDEIVTNIIKYAFTDNRIHSIKFNFAFDKDLNIEIIDDGQYFNPLEISAPNVEASLEDREIGGLGIYLVKSFIEDIKYYRENDENHLVLNLQIN